MSVVTPTRYWKKSKRQGISAITAGKNSVIAADQYRAFALGGSARKLVFQPLHDYRSHNPVFAISPQKRMILPRFNPLQLRTSL